jgi:hypothetical protein
MLLHDTISYLRCRSRLRLVVVVRLLPLRVHRLFCLKQNIIYGGRGNRARAADRPPPHPTEPTRPAGRGPAEAAVALRCVSLSPGRVSLCRLAFGAPRPYVWCRISSGRLRFGNGLQATGGYYRCPSGPGPPGGPRHGTKVARPSTGTARLQSCLG